MFITNSITRGKSFDCSTIVDLETLFNDRNISCVLAYINEIKYAGKICLPFCCEDYIPRGSHLDTILKPVCFSCLESRDKYRSVKSTESYHDVYARRKMSKALKYWLICHDCFEDGYADQEVLYFIRKIIVGCDGSPKAKDMREALEFFNTEMHYRTLMHIKEWSQIEELLLRSIQEFNGVCRKEKPEEEMTIEEELALMFARNNTPVKSKKVEFNEDVGDVEVTMAITTDKIDGSSFIPYDLGLARIEMQSKDCGHIVEKTVVKESPMIYSPDTVGVIIPLSINHNQLGKVENRTETAVRSYLSGQTVDVLYGIRVEVTTVIRSLEGTSRCSDIKKSVKYKSVDGVSCISLENYVPIRPVSQSEDPTVRIVTYCDLIFRGPDHLIDMRSYVNDALNRDDFLLFDMHGVRELDVYHTVQTKYYYSKRSRINKNVWEFLRYANVARLGNNVWKGKVPEGFLFSTEKKLDYQESLREEVISDMPWPGFYGQVQDIPNMVKNQKYSLQAQDYWRRNYRMSSKKFVKEVLTKDRSVHLVYQCTNCVQRRMCVVTMNLCQESVYTNCCCGAHSNPTELVLQRMPKYGFSLFYDRMLSSPNIDRLLFFSETRWIYYSYTSRCSACCQLESVVRSVYSKSEYCKPCYLRYSGWGPLQYRFYSYMSRLLKNMFNRIGNCLECDDCGSNYQELGVPGWLRDCMHGMVCADCIDKDCCFCGT